MAAPVADCAAEDPASCACNNVLMTWLLRAADVLPVRLLVVEPIALEIEGVLLAKDDALIPVLDAPELEDVDCEPPIPDRSDDREDKG